MDSLSIIGTTLLAVAVILCVLTVIYGKAMERDADALSLSQQAARTPAPDPGPAAPPPWNGA